MNQLPMVDADGVVSLVNQKDREMMQGKKLQRPQTGDETFDKILAAIINDRPIPLDDLLRNER